MAKLIIEVKETDGVISIGTILESESAVTKCELASINAIQHIIVSGYEDLLAEYNVDYNKVSIKEKVDCSEDAS